MTQSTRTGAVVLCYPIGHEYICVHRAYRQLAFLLAQAGFHTLRFDYYGCGDSSGNYEQASLEQWQSDIGAAIAEVKSKSGLSQVSLLGLRLGATLAMLVGARRPDIERLVLWNPVINVKACLEEWIALHNECERALRYAARQQQRGEPWQSHEILGYALTRDLYEQLVHLDISALPMVSPKRIFVTEHLQAVATEQLLGHLQHEGRCPDYRLIASAPIWRQEPMQAVVPYQVLQAIVTWLTEVHGCRSTPHFSDR